MLSEHQARLRIRTKGFLGTCLAGGAAGCMAAWARDGGWFLLPVATMVGALIANAAGAGLGLALRMLARRAGTPRGEVSAEAGLILSAYGAFLGLVLSLILGWPQQAHFWALGGAAAGACLASGLGGLLHVMVYLMALESMDEAGRVAARDKARKRLAKELLWPGDDEGRPGD